MRLEDEIAQKQFRNQAHKLVVNIIYTYNWLMNYQQTMLKPHGITGQQFNVLRILRGQHRILPASNWYANGCWTR